MPLDNLDKTQQGIEVIKDTPVSNIEDTQTVEELSKEINLKIDQDISLLKNQDKKIGQIENSKEFDQDDIIASKVNLNIGESLNQINNEAENLVQETKDKIKDEIEKPEVEKNVEKVENNVSVEGEDKKLEKDKNFEFNQRKEQWRVSARERFGIEDFDIAQFKRIVFDEDAISKAWAEGKRWDYINSGEHSKKFIKGESFDQGTKSFEVMQDLENEIPGCVKKLHEKFGITNFQRYPKEMLVNQLNDIDQQKGMGVLAFAESDYNGAFDNQQKIWGKIYNHKKDKLNFRIIECGSDFELINQILKAKEDSGKKVSFGVISAHSNEDGFSLGGTGNESDYFGKEKIDQLNSEIEESFTENGQLIGNACSSGVIKGWVQKISKIARIDAVGPDEPAAIYDVDFVNDKVIPKYHDNDIYSGYKNGFLLSKKRK
ncbi:MAG: hypothetical protein WDK96_01870 [Candidatus Paceibacterota bacterium]|jgi:hypothetical protein